MAFVIFEAFVGPPPSAVSVSLLNER
jgi:hypothetical protein